MRLTEQHVQQAVTAGLALTDPEQELLDVYRKHGQGLTILRTVLEAMAMGQIVLTQPAPPTPPEGLPGVPPADPEPDIDPEDLKPGGTNGDD